MFTAIDEIDKVTAEDVRKVARRYLVPETRTVVYTSAPPEKPREAAAQEAGK
jgi:predicted Zn-dependent peptidase